MRLWQRSSALAIVAILPLAACNRTDYLNRYDSVTFGAGNAMEANIGIHTIDPFPANANDTDIDVSSIKTMDAWRRYITTGDPDVVRGTSASTP